MIRVEEGRALIQILILERVRRHSAPDPNASWVLPLRRAYNAGFLPCLTSGAVSLLSSGLSQLGGWAVSGQWNRTDFNSTLRTLMRDYATFPFFSLQVGGDPGETSGGTATKRIQASTPPPSPVRTLIESSRVVGEGVAVC